MTSVSVNLGQPDFSAKSVDFAGNEKTVEEYALPIGRETYPVTCMSLGNPHCVVFCDELDAIKIEEVGPNFERHPLFKSGINTEFVRIVGASDLRVRVWERGNGATLACGTGACAAVIAAVKAGYCKKNTDIKVRLPGGNLIVNYSDHGVILTGTVTLVYSGSFEY